MGNPSSSAETETKEYDGDVQTSLDQVVTAFMNKGPLSVDKLLITLQRAMETAEMQMSLGRITDAVFVQMRAEAEAWTVELSVKADEVCLYSSNLVTNLGRIEPADQGAAWHTLAAAAG